MPELPDVNTYVWALNNQMAGHKLDALSIQNPFVLRTVQPGPADCAGKVLESCSRLGKRVVFHLEGDLAVVVHLMIAGRLKWREATAKSRPKALAAFRFAHGNLLLTEAGKKRRASIHIVAGDEALNALDPGGKEPLELDHPDFANVVQHSRHTLKRTLTDPKIFSGIGNAYSDEILHAAKLSPFKMGNQLSDEQVAALFQATQQVLRTWQSKLQHECGDKFPEKVTAFHKDMAVHGKHGQPCPVCGAPVQRIVYTSNEANYCPGCQTDGRILADRALSRLLKDSWPRHLDEL